MVKDEGMTYSVEYSEIDPDYFLNDVFYNNFVEMDWIDICIKSPNNVEMCSISMALSSNKHLKRAVLSLAETLL